jgi:hypothetical protein
MKPTTALITTARFPEKWPEDPDASPPPGRAVAQAVLDSLLSTGCVTSLTRQIDGHGHEHNMWFFDFDFDSHAYHVEIAPGVIETTVSTWMIAISRSRGILGALFGKREGYFEVPDHCLDLVAKSLCNVFGIDHVRFMTADEADREFYGIRHGGPLPRDRSPGQ